MKAQKKSGQKAESLALGTRDIAVLVIFALALVAALCLYFVEYGHMWIFLLPFIVVGFFGYLLRGFYYMLAISVAIIATILVISTYIVRIDVTAVTYSALLILFGLFGLACMQDTFERALFYPFLKRIRALNSANAGFFTRSIGFFFDVHPNMDVRNISVDLVIRDRKLPRMDMTLQILSQIVVCSIYWLYLFIGSYEPAVKGEFPFFTHTVILNMIALAAYAVLITLPLTILRTMNVSINLGTSRISLYSGYVSTMQRIGMILFFMLVIALVLTIPQGMFFAALAVLGVSAAIQVIVAMTTYIVEFYSMEVSTVSEIGKKWKVFMPVSLLEDYSESGGNADLPATPMRDETDYAGIPFEDRGKRY